MIKYNVTGFSTFEISLKEYKMFLEKLDSKFFIKFKDSKELLFFLEIENSDFKKIESCLVYIFYIIKNKITFKITRIFFNKDVTKSFILKNKKEILDYVFLKVDDPKYDLNVDSLLDFTKSKFL
jgi:hypothetical protein